MPPTIVPLTIRRYITIVIPIMKLLFLPRLSQMTFNKKGLRISEGDVLLFQLQGAVKINLHIGLKRRS